MSLARAKELIGQGDRLFSKRSQFMSLCQTIAENFYPLRADFTTTRILGEEFASHLMTSKPLYVHRELSNAFSSMLRPRGKVWFRPRTNDETINEDSESRDFLDTLGERMTRAMYASDAQFIRATKQGDADFAAFGQTVISVDPNRELNGLLYRNWHLRDCAWCENSENRIDVFHREYKIEAREYLKLFPETAAKAVRDCVEKEPYREIKCRHIVVPASAYDMEVKNKDRFKFVSIFVDCENDVVLEEKPRKRLGYVIPRWQTVAGSQYAYSPATIIALPDARMLQAISLTLMEAGEKAVDPPMKIVSDVVGAVNTYAGGLTYVDAEYDEKLGAAIEPIIGGAPPALAWGERKEEKIEAALADIFYLSKLALPPAQVPGDMTKWEAQQRVEEYIRGALPLFEPMEVEYNGGLCEETFHQCMDLNLFGPIASQMPPMLDRQEIRWQFESPLQQAHERAKTESFMQVANITQIAAGADPSIIHDINIAKGYRDAVTGTGAPADWLVPEEQAQQSKAQAAKQAMAEKIAATVSAGADVAGKVGAGVQQLQAAGMGV
jgi:hypothetical protein